MGTKHARQAFAGHHTLDRGFLSSNRVGMPRAFRSLTALSDCPIIVEGCFGMYPGSISRKRAKIAIRN